MPQRVVVKSVITKPTKKEGTNITTIEDEKGAKISAFNDTALAQVHAGDILEVEVSIDGKYTNITGWKLLESKPQPTPPAKESLEPRLPYKDNSVSIEAQVAYKGIMEVWAAGQEIEQRCKDVAIHWALSKLSGKAAVKLIVKESVQPAHQEDSLFATERPVDMPDTITDGVKLFAFAGKHGITLAKFNSLVQCAPNEVQDVAAAWKVLFPDGVK